MHGLRGDQHLGTGDQIARSDPGDAQPAREKPRRRHLGGIEPGPRLELARGREVERRRSLLRRPQFGRLGERRSPRLLPAFSLAVRDLQHVATGTHRAGHFDAGAIQSGHAGDAGDTERALQGFHQG